MARGTALTGTIYKICGAREWQDAEAQGRYEGSPDDRRDGFIHFSTAAQLAGTAEKHFAGRDDLVVIAFASADLGAALKWERSRGGDLFPHLYGELDPKLAQSVRAMNWTGGSTGASQSEADKSA